MDGDDPSVLLAKCENQGLRPAAKLLVADFDGERVQAAADALHAAGTRTSSPWRAGTTAGARSTTCGRRRPPQEVDLHGAGGESLKSDSPSTPTSPRTGKLGPPPKHGEKGESVAASQRPNPALAPVAMDADIVERASARDRQRPRRVERRRRHLGRGGGSARGHILHRRREPHALHVNRNTGRSGGRSREVVERGEGVDRG